MANASTTEAPVKGKGAKEKDSENKWIKEEEFLAQTFDPTKKYMFELADQVPERQHPVVDMHLHRPIPHKPFIPYRNLVFTSLIVWKGQRRAIRYYDGCDTIFIDEQPKEKETIDQFIRQTQRRQFVDGKFGCYGDERMLLLFLFASSFNAHSEFRTRSADMVYIPSDASRKATADSLKLDMIEQALNLAKNAPYSKILIHSDYLGIPLEDYDSGNALTEKEVRTAYRLQASRDAKGFIDSYGNKALEIKYFIKKALSTGIIDTTTNPNKAVWKTSGREICDISGLKSFAALLDRIFEFSQLEEGEEFKVQLIAIYNE